MIRTVETAVSFVFGALTGSVATTVGPSLRYWKHERRRQLGRLSEESTGW